MWSCREREEKIVSLRGSDTDSNLPLSLLSVLSGESLRSSNARSLRSCSNPWSFNSYALWWIYFLHSSSRLHSSSDSFWCDGSDSCHGSSYSSWSCNALGRSPTSESFLLLKFNNFQSSSSRKYPGQDRQGSNLEHYLPKWTSS